VQLSVTTPLEDIRNLLLLTRTEFAKRLGITMQTYTRLLQRNPTIKNSTKRRVADKLGVEHPFLIAELVPTPSAERLGILTDVIERSNQQRTWRKLNPDGTTSPAPDFVLLRGSTNEES
jgi:transcriptional regulator with XRE-family HTH domain